MPPPSPQESPGPPGSPAAGPQQFATTRWTLVAAAGKTATPEARTALAELCRLYWYPLYAFVRRRGYDADEALDLTQGFFTRLIEKNDLADAYPDRGRFRSWLFTIANAASALVKIRLVASSAASRFPRHRSQ